MGIAEASAEQEECEDFVLLQNHWAWGFELFFWGEGVVGRRVWGCLLVWV